jgi:hypothetical protein
MEAAALLGLLGLGAYVSSKEDKREGFVDSTATRTSERTPKDRPTIPGYPRQPNTNAIYDQQFRIPTGGSLPSEPFPKGLLNTTPLHFPLQSTTLPKPTGLQADFPLLQLRSDGVEYNPAGELNKMREKKATMISPLSGVEIPVGDFTHNNMVPFFRGAVKQNMFDSANTSTLDDYTGTGSLQFNKREQAPMFEPSKEPMGNPYGLESHTDFVQGRMVESRNRAGERPVEPIRVGRGLNEGFTQIPSGGFQQSAGNEFIMSRMPRTDDLRVNNNPKLTYNKPVVPGAHYITNSSGMDQIGEANKYRPDRFYIDEKNERVFTTAADSLKPAVRSAQVVKDTTRQATTREYSGVAGQAEGKQTYTVGATKTPLVKQHGPFGFRNADLSEYFNPDTDAEENDYGKHAIEIRPNERFYTGERVHATNLKPDAGEGALHLQDDAKGSRKELTVDWDFLGISAPAYQQPKLTVYDPDDVARTTVKETTIDDNRVGIASSAGFAQKLTVYDPDDIARVTGRNTLDDIDYNRNAGATAANPSRPEHRYATQQMRQYSQRENISKGRESNGVLRGGLFNGEDYISLTYRKLFGDSVNDRAPASNRTQGPSASKEAVGIQRPRAVLKLDIAEERNDPVFVSSLEKNPYNIALHKGGVPTAN